jgi:pilus assembly protein Flp/PilA
MAAGMSATRIGTTRDADRNHPRRSTALRMPLRDPRQCRRFKNIWKSIFCSRLIKRLVATCGLLHLKVRRIGLRTLFTNLMKDESGVTAIEYGLIAALVAVAAIAGMNLLGTGLINTFTAVANSL